MSKGQTMDNNNNKERKRVGCTVGSKSHGTGVQEVSQILKDTDHHAEKFWFYHIGSITA